MPSRLRKKSASGVLAALRSSPYGASTIRLFACCGLLDGLVAQPAGDADTDTTSELIVTYYATIEFFRSLLYTPWHDDLVAALNRLDGNVIGDCLPRHRHQEFIRFLKKIDAETLSPLDLHLIVDNYGTHKHPRVKSWVRRHPRFHLHVIPTSSSWLNMVERWLRDPTDKRIRRGSFRNVRELMAAIDAYVHHHNLKPRVFTWTASAEHILANVAKCQEALDALH